MSNRVKQFFNFMIKRENIRMKKAAGYPAPWTDDEILQNYKFTNVKREHDRTTVNLRETFYENPKYKDYSPEAHFLNTIIFRHTGRFDTAQALGYQKTFNPKHLRKVINERLGKGLTVYTGAYMLPAYGDTDPKVDILIKRTLTPFWANAEHLVSVAQETMSWEMLLKEMSPIHGFGGSQFMAKEVLLDTFFTPMWNGELPTDLNTYCPVGPGAERGLNRVFGRPVKKSVPFEKKLEEMLMIFDLVDRHLPEDFIPLILHDIQFQLCEFDKYERVRLGEGRPRNRYNGTGNE